MNLIGVLDLTRELWRALGWVGKGHSHPVWQLWEGTSHPLAAAGKKIYQPVRAKDLQEIQVFGPVSTVQVFT